MEIALLIAVLILSALNIALLFLNKNKSNDDKISQIQEDMQRIEEILQSELKQMRNENRISERENRQEIFVNINYMGENLSKSMDRLAASQRTQLDIFSSRLKDLAKLFSEQQAQNRQIMETTLNQLRKENVEKLDEIRTIVDDKLKSTLEERFDKSFKLISERLELVHKGLGEMQSLASGVGDLKKVLTNVKTRGNLGEIQLGNILSQILSPEQYIVNAQINKMTSERVEYAIKLPGQTPKNGSLLLPIDSKFPTESYQRLLNAYDTGQNIEEEGRNFEIVVKKNAEDIKQKYILPPYTTDFAIMFVPTEGLYAEILRRTGLFETLRREYKITVAGPANLAAFLSSLQMGFRTLAIEKRSGEVWQLLSTVKTDFSKFGDILDKTKKKLIEATNVIDQAGVRTRAIERHLGSIDSVGTSNIGEIEN